MRRQLLEDEMPEYQPRWIADLAAGVMYERQQDGSYAPAYRLGPLK